TRGDGSESRLRGRVRRGTGFHNGVEVHHRDALLPHKQQRQAVLQNDFFVRRQVQGLRARSARRKSRRQQNSEDANNAVLSHGLAFSSFCGSSVATVRLLSPKYAFATRCTSSFVTAPYFAAASNSCL